MSTCPVICLGALTEHPQPAAHQAWFWEPNNEQDTFLPSHPGLPVQPQSRVPCGQRSPTLRGCSLFWRAAQRRHRARGVLWAQPPPSSSGDTHALPLTLSLGLQQPQAWLIRASPPLAPGLNPGGGCPHGQPQSSKPGTPVRLLLKSPLFPWARSRVWLIRPQPATVQGP